MDVLRHGISSPWRCSSSSDPSSSASKIASLLTSISWPMPRRSMPCTPCAAAAPTICGQLQVGHTSVEIDSFIKLNATHLAHLEQSRNPDVHPGLRDIIDVDVFADSQFPLRFFSRGSDPAF